VAVAVAVAVAAAAAAAVAAVVVVVVVAVAAAAVAGRNPARKRWRGSRRGCRDWRSWRKSSGKSSAGWRGG
jgi:hypothetical protein